MPTRDQLTANIDAMEKQGASQPEIQGYLDSFKIENHPAAPAAPAPQQPVSFGQKILNAGTAVTNFLGLKGAADSIGTNLANIGNTLNPTTSLQQKINTSQNLPQGSLKQSIGAGLQLGATTAGMTAAPTSIAGAALTGAGLGASQFGGKTLAEGGSITQAAKGAAIGGAVGGILGGATSVLGHFIGKLGDKITTTAIKPNAADIKDGFSIDTIKKYNLGGSLSTMYDKTETQMTGLTRQLNEKLGASGAKVDLAEVLANTEKSLNTNQFKSFGSNTSIANAINQLKGEIDNIAGETGGAISIPEAQLVKQSTGRFGAWQYGVQDPEATARQAVYTAFYNQLKTAIEKNSPAGVQQINRQLSDLIPVMNAIIRRIPVAERNNALSLQDMLTLTAGAFNPHALIGFGISLAQKEGAVGNLLGKFGPALSSAAGPVSSLGSTLGNAVRPPAAIEPQSPTQGLPVQSTSPNPSTNADGINPPQNYLDQNGQIHMPGLHGQDTTLDPLMGLGIEGKGAKAAITASEVLKDALISKLEKGSPSFAKAMASNPNLGQEIKGIVQSLKANRIPHQEDLHKALELARLQGHDVKPLVDQFLKMSQTAFEQIRNKFGKYTGEFKRK